MINYTIEKLFGDLINKILLHDVRKAFSYRLIRNLLNPFGIREIIGAKAIAMELKTKSPRIHSSIIPDLQLS